MLRSTVHKKLMLELNFISLGGLKTTSLVCCHWSYNKTSSIQPVGWLDFPARMIPAHTHKHRHWLALHSHLLFDRHYCWSISFSALSPWNKKTELCLFSRKSSCAPKNLYLKLETQNPTDLDFDKRGYAVKLHLTCGHPGGISSQEMNRRCLPFFQEINRSSLPFACLCMATLDFFGGHPFKY